MGPNGAVTGRDSDHPCPNGAVGAETRSMIWSSAPTTRFRQRASGA